MIMPAENFSLSAPTAPISTRVIVSDEEFAALKPCWSALLARSRANTIFLTWEWLYTWWQHFGAPERACRLAIVVAERAGAVVGIAPLYVHRQLVKGVLPLKSLQWLGSGEVGSDYLDIIAEPECELDACSAVYREIERLDWDLVRLTEVPADSARLSHLRALFSLDKKYECRDGREYRCPYIELAGHSWESYEQTLSANMRYNLRRRAKQAFQQLKASVARVESAQQIAPMLDEILALHARRWQARGGSDGFCGERIRAFHHSVAHRLYERGWLRLYLLSIDGRAVAGIYGMEYGDTFSFYQSGFDPAWDRNSVGMVLMRETVAEAIARDITVYDFLHGTEEYKYKWTATEKRTRSLLVHTRAALMPRLYFWLKALRQSER